MVEKIDWARCLYTIFLKKNGLYFGIGQQVQLIQLPGFQTQVQRQKHAFALVKAWSAGYSGGVAESRRVLSR